MPIASEADVRPTAWARKSGRGHRVRSQGLGIDLPPASQVAVGEPLGAAAGALQPGILEYQPGVAGWPGDGRCNWLCSLSSITRLGNSPTRGTVVPATLAWLGRTEVTWTRSTLRS